MTIRTKHMEEGDFWVAWEKEREISVIGKTEADAIQGIADAVKSHNIVKTQKFEIGDWVKIFLPLELTHGMLGMIIGKEGDKFEVDFSPQWGGWYSEEQMYLIDKIN